MKLLILLIIIFIILVVRLFIIKEGFETITLQQNFIDKYNSFIAFYNPFLVNWEEAITTAISTNIKQQPSPNINNKSSPPKPTKQELNKYIRELSEKNGKPLPEITEPLPEQINSESILQISKIIPSDTNPYFNALQWMNTQLIASQNNLDSALKGNTFKIEGFDNQLCTNFETCFTENPEMIDKLIDIQNNRKLHKINDIQKEMENNMNKFNDNQQLQNEFKTNNKLIKKSKEIQQKAESGELLNSINISDKVSSYSIPLGGDNLEKMKENDPTKYNQLKNNYSQLFSMKQLMEQINNNLR
jgi:hypothetical protein